ncbi:calcium-binding protein [Mesorhizobium sp. M0809]|uniref:calcium-binding protein n=1 Tax=Mesorhizobium sp. M0809 TaxID=2957003 RepID=UPI0033367297
MTTLHYTSGGSGTEIAQAGFNLADVSSVDQLNALPDGMKGLVYLNETDGATSSFIDKITPFIGNPKLFGFFLVDEPDPTGQWGTYASAANLKAESDWIHANVPDAKTYITMMSLGTSANPDFSGTYNPANTGIDYYGVDVYPVRTDGAVDYNMIDKFVAAAQASGIPTSKIIPGYQTFGGGDYNTDMGGKYVVPTAAQMETMMDHWAKLVPSPAFEYAYAWGSQRGDTALESSPELQAVFRQHNLSTAGTAPSEAAATDPISTVPSEATTGDSTSTATAPSEATSSGGTSTATAPAEATSSGGTSTATAPSEATSSGSTSTATAPAGTITGGSTSTATAPSEATTGDSNHGKTMLSHLLAGNGGSTTTAASGATASDGSHGKTALSHLLASDGSSTTTAAPGTTASDGSHGKTALSPLLASDGSSTDTAASGAITGDGSHSKTALSHLLASDGSSTATAASGASTSDGSHGKTALSHLLASDGSSTDTTQDNAGDKVSEGSSVDRILASLSHSLSAGSELLATNDPSDKTATIRHGFAQTVQPDESVGAQAKNGAAAEIMSGHGGNDAFDFSKLQDKLHLDQAALTELKSGGLSLHTSPAGTATDDGSHHIIFDSSTGSLSLDSDAVGSAAQAQLATHLPLQHHSLI